MPINHAAALHPPPCHAAHRPPLAPWSKPVGRALFKRDSPPLPSLTRPHFLPLFHLGNGTIDGAPITVTARSSWPPPPPSTPIKGCLGRASPRLTPHRPPCLPSCTGACPHHELLVAATLLRRSTASLPPELRRAAHQLAHAPPPPLLIVG
jgi:hypothetical protein